MSEERASQAISETRCSAPVNLVSNTGSGMLKVKPRFYLRVSPSFVKSDFSCAPLWQDEWVPRKQVVALAQAQRQPEVVVVERAARRRPEQVAVVR